MKFMEKVKAIWYLIDHGPVLCVHYSIIIQDLNQHIFQSLMDSIVLEMVCVILLLFY